MVIKNCVLCLILTVTMCGGYVAVKHLGKGKLNENISSVLWGIPFIIYSFWMHRTAWTLPIMENTEYIPYAIGAISLETILVLYFQTDTGQNMPCPFYQQFIRQTIIECVISGVLLPALFMVPVLVYWLRFSFLYINAAVVLVSLLQVFLHWLDNREYVLSVIELVLDFAVCVLHALIIVFTGSVLIPVILRAGYGIFAWRKGRVYKG